jgi:GNAT superfamily N-acetyltransferase
MLAAIMGPERDLAAERMARGVRCYGAWIEQKLVAYGWLSVGPEWIGEIQLEISPRPGEGYVWNCVTLPEFRRRGIFRALLLGISEHARSLGLRRLWLGSVAIPAEKALGPAGFKPALQSRLLSRGGWHVAFVRAAQDQSLAEDAKAVLRSGPGVRVWRSHTRRH